MSAAAWTPSPAASGGMPMRTRRRTISASRAGSSSAMRTRGGFIVARFPPAPRGRHADSKDQLAAEPDAEQRQQDPGERAARTGHQAAPGAHQGLGGGLSAARGGL